MNIIDRIKNPIAFDCIKSYSPPPTPPTTGSNIKLPKPTLDERFAITLGKLALEELAEVLTDKSRQIAELLAKVDDLAQELAVTQSQLEEARKRLKRYEGGTE